MGLKLFVGGLAFSTSSDRLREVFAALGTVESASVVTDPETGRSRGFGFVQMGSEEEAQLAVSSLNGKDLDGRSIRVEIAKPSERGGGGSRRGDRPPRGGGRGRAPRW
jgi:RNA recognition motif-containing protein